MRSPAVAFRAVPALLWAGAIWASSEVPGTGLPSVPGLAPAAHFVEYAILAVLVTFAMSPRKTLAVRILVAVLLATAFGVMDELHQSFTPGRTPDVMDVVVDSAGAALGATIVGRTIDSIRAKNLSH